MTVRFQRSPATVGPGAGDGARGGVVGIADGLLLLLQAESANARTTPINRRFIMSFALMRRAGPAGDAGDGVSGKVPEGGRLKRRSHQKSATRPALLELASAVAERLQLRSGPRRNLTPAPGPGTLQPGSRAACRGQASVRARRSESVNGSGRQNRRRRERCVGVWTLRPRAPGLRLSRPFRDKAGPHTPSRDIRTALAEVFMQIGLIRHRRRRSS